MAFCSVVASVYRTDTTRKSRSYIGKFRIIYRNHYFLDTTYIGQQWYVHSKHLWRIFRCRYLGMAVFYQSVLGFVAQTQALELKQNIRPQKWGLFIKQNQKEIIESKYEHGKNWSARPQVS